MQMDARLYTQELQEQVQQLQQEREMLQQQAYSRSSDMAAGAQQHVAAVADTNGEPAAFAVRFSRALQTADADRSAAAKRAVEAERAAAELRQQVAQQEQELVHMQR